MGSACANLLLLVKPLGRVALPTLRQATARGGSAGRQAPSRPAPYLRHCAPQSDKVVSGSPVARFEASWPAGRTSQAVFRSGGGCWARSPSHSPPDCGSLAQRAGLSPLRRRPDKAEAGAGVCSHFTQLRQQSFARFASGVKETQGRVSPSELPPPAPFSAQPRPSRIAVVDLCRLAVRP